MERNATSGMSIGNGLGLGLERLARPGDGTGLSADERRELWTRLEAFALDDIDAHAPFSARLAREQGWSRSFARRVIEEYKKFLYLGCVGEHRCLTHGLWNALGDHIHGFLAQVSLGDLLAGRVGQVVTTPVPVAAAVGVAQERPPIG